MKHRALSGDQRTRSRRNFRQLSRLDGPITLLDLRPYLVDDRLHPNCEADVCNIVGKKIELLRETLGSLPTLAIAGNVSNPGSLLEIKEAVKVAARLGVDTTTLDFRYAEDIEPAFETIKGRAAALYVSTDPFILSNVDQINKLALRARLPTVYNGKEYLQSGGLLSYGPNYPDLFRQAAGLVSKIAKPADLPVEQHTQFDFVVNKTAKALGLTLSPSILARANEVIE